MQLLHIPSETYPYSILRLGQDYSATVWPANPTAADLVQGTGGDVVLVASTEPPPCDPATQRLQESYPALVGDAWQQVWEITDLTSEEQAEWAAAHRPLPNWGGFLAAFFADPTFAQAIEAARGALDQQQATASPEALPSIALAGLSLGELGSLIATAAAPNADPSALMQAWANLYAVGLVSQEIQSGILALANAFHLPPEVIQALQPPSQ